MPALIHVSAIGADENSSSRYARAKALGERAVLAARPSATIFRPSIIFGPEDDFFNRFGSLARFLPALPLIGGGLTRFQPVFVGDVAEAIRALQRTAARGSARSMISAGRRSEASRHSIEYVLQLTQRKRLLLPLPFPLARMQAQILQYLPSRRSHPTRSSF